MKDDSKTQPSSSGVSGATAGRLEQRRRAVRSILLAGGGAVAAAQPLSKQWVKPVIDVVTLPAHASATGDPEFSISDPVTLSYTCTHPTTGNFLVDIEGFISVPLAGVQVDLVLSWVGGTPPPNSPINLQVFTQADGSYSSLDNDIGSGQVTQINVSATLPAFPDAGEDTDSIPAFSQISGTYYCLVVD